MQFDRKILATTFVIGVASLMYELIQVRMLAFFLGNSMDIMAIPIALLGLAIGSMWRHFLWKGGSEELVKKLSLAVFPLMLASFFMFFAVANTFFSHIHVAISTPPSEASKVVIYSLIFLPPYVAFGALFSTLFSEFSDKIGKLYFFDLAGAGLGCVLTPLMLTWFGLPPAILLCLFITVLLFVIAQPPKQLAAGAFGTWLIVSALGIGGVVFRERPDPATLGRTFLKHYRDGGVQEVDAQWNEIARTSLLRAGAVKGKHGSKWAIVQDNGLSNVKVKSYRPEAYHDDAANRWFHHGFPWNMGMNPKTIMVMFAGIGRDMLAFDELAKGDADIVGVEINRHVVEWQTHPALAGMHLKEFHEKPNIDLRNEEGRDFLNTDERTFDVIYVANNGAVHAGRTGHTRKYLDTYEAMTAYIEKLNPGGVIIFTAQPAMDKIASFRKIFEEKGLGDFSKAVYIFGPGHVMLDSMVVKPSGLTPSDLAALDRRVNKNKTEKILYRPGTKPIPRLEHLLTAPLNTLKLTTDDLPFTSRVNWEEFTLLPDPKRYRDGAYVSGWVKVFTVLMFSLVSAIIAGGAALLGTKEQRVPTLWVGYLLLTGVGYMCVEIPLIAKTELFIGNPLYAVSINLATFLLFNAVGSYLQDEYKLMKNPLYLMIAVVLAVVWGAATAAFSSSTLLAAPFVLKAVGVAIIVFPPGVVLGTFYPYAVHRLLDLDHSAAIPMTYGLTTLASVLGSAFAMAAIINVGFTNVMVFGTTLYIVAAGLSLAARAAE